MKHRATSLQQLSFLLKLKQTFRRRHIISDNDVEDMESGTAGESDVIANEKSGVAVRGIDDGQDADVLVRVVSDPASSGVHVSQSTSTGHQL